MNRLVGCRIVSDPHVPPGSVVFKDRNGKELARIENIGGPVDKSLHFCKDCDRYKIHSADDWDSGPYCNYDEIILNKFSGEEEKRIKGDLGWNKNGRCPKFIKKKPPLSERIFKWYKKLRVPT